MIENLKLYTDFFIYGMVITIWIMIITIYIFLKSNRFDEDLEN